MELLQWVKPLGAICYALFVLTALTGLFIRKSPRKMMKAHKLLAVSALSLGAIHGGIVVYFNYFY